MKLFIMCGQGLEPLLEEELIELGIQNTQRGFCGIYVDNASMTDLYTINYCSRIASRVLSPLLFFRCIDSESLYKKTVSVDWGSIIKKGASMAIDANVNHPKIRNSLYAAQVTKDAICDRLRKDHGFRPIIDTQLPDIQINLFINNSEATISLDTSGQPLHKRAYRLRAGAAPMQETLAAALLRIARYDGKSVVCDPCCGAGTLLIEAALIASKTPPGYLRKHWGFFFHPNFDEAQFLAVKQNADNKKKELSKGFFWGIEREPEIADFCRANCEEAGFGDVIDISAKNFMSHTPKAPINFLITNPPHGKRLASEQSLIPLYRGLGDFMKQKMQKPARGFIFTMSHALAKEVGLQAKRRHVIKSSGMDARLLEFDIYSSI